MLLPLKTNIPELHSKWSKKRLAKAGIYVEGLRQTHREAPGTFPLYAIQGHLSKCLWEIEQEKRPAAFLITSPPGIRMSFKRWHVPGKRIKAVPRNPKRIIRIAAKIAKEVRPREVDLGLEMSRLSLAPPNVQEVTAALAAADLSAMDVTACTVETLTEAFASVKVASK